MNQISNWGEAALTSVAAALALFLAAIPRVIGFLIILLVGWFIANLIAKLVASLLRRVNFNGLAERSGLSGFVAGMGIQTDAAGFIALIVKWFIRLIALVVAFDALGLPAVSEVLRTFLLWIPNLVVGVLVLVIGGLLANAAAGIVRGDDAGQHAVHGRGGGRGHRAGAGLRAGRAGDGAEDRVRLVCEGRAGRYGPAAGGGPVRGPHGLAPHRSDDAGQRHSARRPRQQARPGILTRAEAGFAVRRR